MGKVRQLPRFEEVRLDTGVRNVGALTFRIVMAVLGLTLLGIQALISRDVWTAPAWVQALLVIIVGFIALSDNVRSSIKEYSYPKAEGKRARIQKSAVGALAQISKDSGHDLMVLGVSVFAVRKKFTRVFYIFPVRKPQLKRIERFRLTNSPQASTVKWVAGKGCIGEAWETRRQSYKDWRRIAEKYGEENLTKAQFDRLPAGTRSGFTYEEFRGIVDKYAEILAVPIMSVHGETVLGIISIDRPMIDSEDPQQILGGKSALGIAESAAVAIRDDI